jgi:hypothetical protein
MVRLLVSTPTLDNHAGTRGVGYAWAYLMRVSGGISEIRSRIRTCDPKYRRGKSWVTLRVQFFYIARGCTQLDAIIP